MSIMNDLQDIFQCVSRNLNIYDSGKKGLLTLFSFLIFTDFDLNLYKHILSWTYALDLLFNLSTFYKSQFVSLDYGMEDTHPIEHVRFFYKQSDVAVKVEKEEVWVKVILFEYYLHIQIVLDTILTTCDYNILVNTRFPLYFHGKHRNTNCDSTVREKTRIAMTMLKKP